MYPAVKSIEGIVIISPWGTMILMVSLVIAMGRVPIVIFTVAEAGLRAGDHEKRDQDLSETAIGSKSVQTFVLLFPSIKDKFQRERTAINI